MSSVCPDTAQVHPTELLHVFIHHADSRSVLCNPLCQHTADKGSSSFPQKVCVCLTQHSAHPSSPAGCSRSQMLKPPGPICQWDCIIQPLSVLQGSDILDFIGLIPREENPPPIICAYIDLNLTTLHNTGLISGPLPRPCNQVLSSHDSSSQGSPPSIGSPTGLGTNPPISPDRPFGHVALASGVGSPGSQDDVKADLAAIFKKIGDKANSKAGMEELFQFQLEHPHVSCPFFLKLCLHARRNSVATFTSLIMGLLWGLNAA